MRRSLIALLQIVLSSAVGAAEYEEICAASSFFRISREESEQLCANDPAVKAGRLSVELHPWYSAKGIRVGPPKQ